MPEPVATFERPTYAELVDRMQSSLNGYLVAAGYKPLFLERWLLWILVRVFAAAVHSTYGTLDWLSRQFLPTTADREGLVSFATLYGLEPLDATPNTITVLFTGTNGTAIPSGTEIVRDDGLVYVTTAAGSISGSTATIAAEADTAGVIGNVETGVTLTLASPISGIDSEATVATSADVGADDEDTEAFRDRVLERIRETPQGGAAGDYVAWAKTVTGVYRAKALPLARGAGTVDVVFLHESGSPPLGIPSGGQITSVQTAIDALRPVLADVVVAAPGTVSVAVTVTTLVPDTTDVQDAVEAEWNALMRAKALTSGGTSLYVSELYSAAMAAAGITAITISVPSSTTTCADDEAFTLGAITWPS